MLSKRDKGEINRQVGKNILSLFVFKIKNLNMYNEILVWLDEYTKSEMSRYKIK